MTGDKLAEVSGKGGKGKVLWRPSRSVDAGGGGGQRAVPPWADPDAQAPPPPSTHYVNTGRAPSSSHTLMKAGTGMATGVQANPNPTHFNRPSPRASPIMVRKSLFRTNIPTRSRSIESLNKSLPGITTHKDGAAPPAAEDDGAQETDTLCPMVMTGDSRSRKTQMGGRVSSPRSASLPRGVGHGGGESLPTHNILPGGGSKLPEGRGMGEAPPPSQPIQSQSMGGHSANESQSVPRPPCHAQPGIHSSHHTGADLPDSADAKLYSPERMVSAKPTGEAKAPLTTQQQQQQQPEQSSPTPWRKVRPAPAELPPEQTSPTPWRKNIISPDTAAKAAPSQQQQPSWRGSKGDVSAGSVSEGRTTFSSAVKGQEAPWRKAAPQQTTPAAQSISSSTSTSVVTSSSSTTIKQTQLLQKSQVTVGVHSEDVIKVKADTERNLGSQTTTTQPSWRKQPPKNQPTSSSSPQPAPSGTGTIHPSAPTTVAQPSVAPPAAFVTSCAPAVDNVTSGPVNKPVSVPHGVNKPASPNPLLNKQASSIPAANKPASPIPTVSQSPSPIPAANKVTSSAAAANVTTFPGTANKTTSSVPATDKPTSQVPAANKPASPVPAANKPAAPVPAANKPASPVPAANKPASPVPAANKPASTVPAANKPASPVPAANKPASTVPAANKPASPVPAANKPISPILAVNKPGSSAPTVDKPASPTPAVIKPQIPVTEVNKPAPPPLTTIKNSASSLPDAKKSVSPASSVNKPATPPPTGSKSVSSLAVNTSTSTVTNSAVVEPVSSLTDINKNICSTPANQTPFTNKPSSSIPLSSSRVDQSLLGKSGPDSSVSPSPLKAKSAVFPKQEAVAPPLAFTALTDTRSPTPPLPPKQTVAAIVSVPALPLAPKPPLASIDQSIPPPQTIPPPAQSIPPPPPSHPILPTQLTGAPLRKSPPPGIVPADLVTTTTCVSSTPPVPDHSSVAGPKSADSMTSVVSTPPVSLPMSVPSPPPALVPTPPPEPVPKTVKSKSPSSAADTKISTPEKAIKADDKMSAEVVTRLSPSSSKSQETVLTSSPPHPEFPPPPPLEESDPQTSRIEVDQTLPPPPSFVREQKSATPPVSLYTDYEERDDLQEDDFPSPEYVRESVTKRIKAFEKQGSRDDDTSPVDRPAPAAKPVAPWVKKTSSGIVNQDCYWGMTSPEEEETVWPAPTIAQREAEFAKSRPRPQTKEAPSSSFASKGAPSPPPPPSTPTAGVRGPSAGKPTPAAAASTAAKAAAPQKHREPILSQRTTSTGEYQAQYFPPEESRSFPKMPAEGDVPVTTPEDVKSISPVKHEDPPFDPWCDPKNPRVISFQDVSAAAFKIKSGIMNTPCTRSHMSCFTDMEIYFKKEFNQYTGSFKERGARYTLLMLSDEQKKKGVITASAGNHALALSYHGQVLGTPVTVVMPLVAPIMKVQACRQYGANIIVRGNDIGECREFALKMAKEQDLLYINGYDHPHILAGQGTMGLEIVEQVKDIDAVVIPVGGGGLIAGVALAVKALYPHVKVIGVESEMCASFSGALKAGRPVYVKAQTTLADGLAVPCVGVNAFATASKLIDKVVTVPEEWIAIAILRLVETEKAVVEGAGATALAAILSGELPELKGKRIVIPLCGGNIDTTVLGRCLERGLAADGRLVKFTVTVSDRPGGIAELTRLLANLGVSIKDMMHERAWIKNDIFSVEVKVIAETRDHDHYKQLRKALESQYEKLRFVSPNQIHSDDDL